MEPEDLLRFVRDVCNRLQITYAIVGSTATIAYGEPRFTNDIDVVLDLSAEQVDRFRSEFPEADFYISRSAVELAVKKNFQFNVIHPASGLKIDFMVLSDSAFDQSRRTRRRELSVLADGPTWFASPEDVILKKMVYHKEGGSDKHLRDIAGVLRIQGDQLDREYVSRWAGDLNVLEIWTRIQDREHEDP